jgi:hypothetical protein
VAFLGRQYRGDCPLAHISIQHVVHSVEVRGMKITVSLASLAETKPHEYLLRFVLGGLITAVVGLVTTALGPVIGGLFLAFPSIFPATVTLVERHEARKKEEHGVAGLQRARCAAAADAVGAAIGSFGLSLFGLIVWLYVNDQNAWLVLGGATAAWFLFATTLWFVHKRFRPRW